VSHALTIASEVRSSVVSIAARQSG
jgi:hypothetical protein